MRKYILSTIVITAFIAYSFYQRTFGQQAAPVLTSKHISDLPVAPPTSTPTPSAAPTQIPTATATIAHNQPTPTQSPPTATPSPQLPTPTTGSGLKDGTFTGNPADAFYGIIQVQTTIANGKIADIKFLQYPNDRNTSIAINEQADPMLAQEAIQAQSAQVDIISGATDSSQAFIESLQSALDKAKS